MRCVLCCVWEGVCQSGWPMPPVYFCVQSSRDDSEELHLCQGSPINTFAERFAYQFPAFLPTPSLPESDGPAQPTQFCSTLGPGRRMAKPRAPHLNSWTTVEEPPPRACHVCQKRGRRASSLAAAWPGGSNVGCQPQIGCQHSFLPSGASLPWVCLRSQVDAMCN